MKKLPLNKGKFTLVDDDVYEWAVVMKWYENNTGYAVYSKYLGKVNGKYRSATPLLHRIIMDAPKGLDVDHINGNTLDNQRSNLRVVTRSQNKMNSIKPMKTKHHELPTGVTYSANPRSLKKFTARINFQNKPIFIGNYVTVDEAKVAYEEKANELFNKYRRVK